MSSALPDARDPLESLSPTGMNVVILGAGLSGLSCAYELAKAGHKVTILEREPWVGGMASSHEVEGYWLDHGPHRFHSYNKELVQHLYEVLDQKVLVRDRLSRIYMRGRFFNYPLKLSNVLRNMPPHLIVKAFWDYAWIRLRDRLKPIPDSNFRNWVLKRFGKTLAEMFFVTYTEKAWKMPATEISADWASQRITLLNLWDTVKKTVLRPKEGKDKPRTLVSEFWYPAEGGIGQISRGYESKIRAMGGDIHLDTPVEQVLVEGGVARAVTYRQNGALKRLDADMIVSTIPLPRLIEHLSPAAPPACEQAIAALRYIAIVFVYLEVSRSSLSKDHWIYLPEKHLTIHRICEFKNFDDNAGPQDKTVVCCEITCLRGDESWNLTLEQAAQVAERDLVTVGLLEPGISRGLWLTKLRYAYPVYDLTYKQNLQTLIDHVRGIQNLDTTGRQGLYRYNNMDHSVAMGRAVAKTLHKKGKGDDHTRVAAGQEYFG
jgi:protoporphyrinogen oxidase